MKQLVTLMAIGVLVVAGYKFHTDQIKAARAAGNRSAPELITLSSALETHYRNLFSQLESDRPVDLVPPLELTRDRLVNMQTQADPEKRAVYAQASTLVEAMINFGEERTKALEAVVRAAKTRGSLETPQTTSTSSAFFAQKTLQRWETERLRWKPTLDQLMARLRNAEAEWNKRVGKNALPEKYDLPKGKVYIILDGTLPTSNSLGANDQKRTYPWRRHYYQINGYPQYTR